MNTSSCIYPELIDLLRQYPDCVLVTVVSTRGSTPQKAGSSALIGPEGLLAGTVGGGMTELKVIQQSQLLLKTKKSKLLSFELHGEIAKGSESICGGSMTLLMDASPAAHLSVFTLLKNSLASRGNSNAPAGWSVLPMDRDGRSAARAVARAGVPSRGRGGSVRRPRRSRSC